MLIRIHPLLRSMKTKLFIPQKLQVGFQNREGTYTGKLAYVIYYDEKAKLRKQASWTSWCDASIPAVIMENKPRAGFVLNKGVARYSDWGSGRSVIRIHDPDGFEFEISVDNLIGILMHSDVSKRDIAEACVYAWAGSDLVLLPVNSDAYRESVAYTEKQSGVVSAKSLVPGRKYQKKKQDDALTYIGYYPWYEFTTERENRDRGNAWYGGSQSTTQRTTQVAKGKRHVFHDGRNFVIPSVSTFSHEVSPDIDDNLAALESQLLATPHTQRVVGFRVEPLRAEPLIVQSRGTHKVYSLTDTLGVISSVVLPYTTLDFFRRSRELRTTATVVLLGNHCRYNVDSAYSHSITYHNTSDRSDIRIDLPEHVARILPAESGAPAHTYGTCTGVTFDRAGDYSWDTVATYSQPIVELLQARGYGYLYAVLENGNSCQATFL